MTDVDLSTRGDILAPKTDKIALIDADTICFAAALVCEYSEQLLPKKEYTEEEWAIISNDPGYVEEDNCIYGINIQEAVEHSMDKINRILEATGCKDFYLHFTSGRESFRYTKVDMDYKINRVIDSQGKKTRAPFGLYSVKQELCRKYPLKAKMWVECEADDAVWWLGDKYPEKYTVVALDKDVLGGTKARAFNYFERHGYIHPKSNNKIEPINMKWVQAEEPELFWYYQCVIGDSGDGIIGIKGMGPAKTKKALSLCKSDVERWETIVKLYEDNGRTMIDALSNMRMVRLDQYNPETNELKLWDPRTLK